MRNTWIDDPNPYGCLGTMTKPQKWFKLKLDLPWYIRWRPSVRRWLRDCEKTIEQHLKGQSVLPAARPRPKLGMFGSWSGYALAIFVGLIPWTILGLLIWLATH